MRILILASAILAVIGTPSVFARTGHRHPDHRQSITASSTPINPNKADTRSPEKRDPEDSKIDQRIRSICRGC
jgi:hypothetical protein